MICILKDLVIVIWKIFGKQLKYDDQTIFHFLMYLGCCFLNIIFEEWYMSRSWLCCVPMIAEGRTRTSRKSLGFMVLSIFKNKFIDSKYSSLWLKSKPTLYFNYYIYVCLYLVDSKWFQTDLLELKNKTYMIYLAVQFY